MIDGPLYQASSGDFFQSHSSTFISAGSIDQQQQGQGSTNSFVDQVLAIFGKVQKIVDDLNLAGCSNLRAYVSDLNARLEARLHMELSAVVGIWVDEFNDWPHNGTRVIPEDSITIHELLMLQDGPSTRLVLKPSIEEARAGLMERLSVLLAKLCHFPRIRHGRYDNVTTSGKDGATESERGTSSSFMNLVSNYPDDQVLSQAYEAIDSTVCRMAKYVYDWQKYEALWRAEPSALFNELGDDIEAWQQLLSEIRIARTAVDATRDTEAFGPVAIDFSPIQEQVLHKYDQWQREVLQAFAMQMADQTRSMLSQLEKARGSLERQTLAVTSCREIAEFVTCVREAQGNAGKTWAQRVVSLRAGEKLLERQRYAFPRDWVWTDRVEGEWTALEQVLNRRVKLLEESKDKVEHMIAFHDTKVMEQIDSLYEEWGTMRSHQTVAASTESPTRALQTISVFDSRLQKVQADLSQVIKAKLVLDLDCSNERRLDPLREDVSNLRAVWEGLGGVHHKLSDISDTPWPAVVPKKIKHSLEQLLEELAQLPDALRQYDAYDDLRTRVNAALSLHPMIADLKSEALKDRHWKQILLILSLGTLSNGVNGLLLGQLWESTAMREREKDLRGLISEAAGELALEEFISSVKDYWTTLNLDLIPYGGGKCHLVKGWEDLFAQLDEHIGSLDAMKHSPHYKVFEADTVAWEDRLTKLRLLLDIWVDVQRRYVYLEGIFCHSEDIRTLLPTESSRFGSVDAEYVSIMKKVFDTKVSIPDIMTAEYNNNTMKTLERLGRTLTRIQKALGDYLEMQRAQFPRFYFVGDEDLLEMIGNSQDLAIITQHVNKMFAGIAGLETCTDEDDANIVWITAFRSKESEIVELGDNHKIPIDVSIDGTGVGADQPEGQGRRRGIHYILSSIETAMRACLRELLTKAMEPSLSIIDLAERFPAQVALLASQARWCNAQSAALGMDGGSAAVAEDCKAELEALSAAGGAVEGDPLLRRKYEQLISEVIHQREISRHLDNEGINSPKHFEWLRILKHRWYPNEMRLDVEIWLPEKEEQLVDRVEVTEDTMILKAVANAVVPKLVGEDVTKMSKLVEEVFPETQAVAFDEASLRLHIVDVCKERGLDPAESFIDKCLQLYQLQKLNHGIILFGPVGSGKSAVTAVLSEALQRHERIVTKLYVLEPKAMMKDDLYGRLDPTTREWTDGVFTDILRKIIVQNSAAMPPPSHDNSNREHGQEGKMQQEHSNSATTLLRHHWIIFDGDVDPNWAENLNSVLDDNKMLTLPSGERLLLPPSVRILFEVDSLKYATMATVSRCGMIWFSPETVTDEMICLRELKGLSSARLLPFLPAGGRLGDSQGDSREGCVDTLLRFFHPGGLVCRSLSYVKELPATAHIMPFTSTRGINAMFSLLSHYVDRAITSCRNASIREKYLDKALILSVCWGFGSSLPLSDREQFARFVASEAEACGVPVPVNSTSSSCLLDYEVRAMDGEWAPWSNKVRSVDLDASQVLDADLVIPTIDTERHGQCINAWIASRRHFILCGPPGSGKSMTLLSALRALGDTLDVVSLNFSSDVVKHLLDGGCGLREGLPVHPDKWLVVFCDEINLPVPDDYGTQRVIMFIRQIIEAQGFYRPSDRSWVEVERILFVGACNPSSDAGRHAMSDRFLRHVPVLFMDYPSTQLQPQLQEYADMLTRAMVSVYTKIGQTFTVVGSGQPHYFYSPRELTRWKIALYEAMGEYDCMSRVELIRLFVHEAMRVFRDRLTTSEERGSADGIIDDAAKEYFGATDKELRRPLMFSHYGSKYYTEIGIERLRVFVGAKLEEFYEESLSVKLSVFDTMLDHMTRIDRVLIQPLGHMLLVGASGVGKTVLSKFVSWMNGLSVYQLKVGKSYDLHSFEADLRHVMKRAGVKGEKICFVFDESNVLGPAFLERMNALLAGGEVPGLFEGDDYQILIQDCRTISEAANTADANELFANFTKQVQRNLHIVFTMNPANPDFHNRKATSPALFNRCVVNWVGDWPTDALLQIAHDSLTRLDLPDNCFVSDDAGKHKPRATMGIEERAISVATSMVCIHESVVKLHDSLRALNKRFAYVTPRDYMDFLRHFETLYSTKRAEWAEQQRHLNLGLEKLHQTGQQVAEMKTQLSSKTELLAEKNKLAEAKMAQMVKGQSEAEQRKRESQSLREKLSEDHQLAASRQEEVARELAEVEPALNHARQLVQAIQRKQVDEMRSLPNPPAPVKITLEAVVCLIRNYGPGVELTWDHIRKELKDPQLMVTVLQFNTDALSVAARERVEGYLKSSAWDMERIERASRAAGPLAQWVKSQISYGKMLQSIGPLRAEVAELEAQQKVSSEKLQANSELLEKLEREIEQYKDEYAQLISEGQSIRVEMEEVSAMCKRSSDLLASLASEKDRWEMQKETYRAQSGEVALPLRDPITIAITIPSGFCEHAYREQLHKEWYRIFDSTDNGPKINSSLSLIEYLSKPGQRLAWIANQLPNDDLSIQNAIIIDKSQGKLKVTSFSDPAFTKHLEAALRFGTALLVTDVQKVDPIINTVLNREIYKKGGRTLITVGDLDVDYSPKLLDSERPDVEEKRVKALKLQGEFRVRIRELEDGLLHALSNVTGSILEDEAIVSTLETLKCEAAEVAEEASKADVNLREIDAVSSAYIPLSTSAANLFFVVQGLSALSNLYQFGLVRYLELYNAHLVRLVYDYVGTGLLAADRLIFLLRVAEIGSSMSSSTPPPSGYMHLLSMSVEEDDEKPLSPPECIEAISASRDQKNFIARLLSAAASGGASSFAASLESSIENDPQGWTAFLSSTAADTMNSIPQDGWQQSEDRVLASLENVIISRWMRPDLVEGYLERYADVALALDPPLTSSFNTPSLQDSIMSESLMPNTTLYILACTSGFDPSLRIVDLAERLGIQLETVAMGSPEGYSLADRAVAVASKQQGRWALLTNMHLCLPYFRTMDRKIPTQTHNQFKLFITIDVGACTGQALPETLMKSGRILMFEAPTGVRPSLMRSYAEVLVSERVKRGPVERNRLHFLLAWLHAIVLERVRYAPVGWTKEFDFSEADLSCAVELTDKWLDEAVEASSSSTDSTTRRELINIDPAKIPWDAIRTTLIDVVYGGRLDNDADRKALTPIVEYLFSPEAFHKNFLLNPNSEPVDKDGALLHLPDARKREDFVALIDTLFAGKPTPQWLDSDVPMRFGRKLALALQNDTEDAPFISHKHLKEILSRQVREIRALDDMDDKETQEAASSKETIRIMDGHFFATLDADIDAMLTYIGTKQESLARSVAALVVRAQQAGLLDQENQPPNGTLLSTLTQVCVVMSQLGGLLSGYLVQCAAYSQLTMILSGSLALGMDLARELETVTEEANKLLAYIDINVAGMRKLLKQHDKQIPAQYQKRPVGSAPYTNHHRLLTDGVLRAVTELNKVRSAIQGLFQVI
ncbi:hypothetical protein FOZ60_003172 [Perkinsus olseni]|uniref:SPX domain-containing protein n=1 Tax=Perkinsus olseni TaxID=32597 RepID=A0A7J6NW68_PEROL|nr:hypothetical protein FOZ60_003172 [Perkinsus olseni]